LLAWRAWGQSRPQAEISQLDLSLLDGLLTPTDLFFLREHFPAPEVSIHGWKLSLGETDLTLDALMQQPRRSLTATLECAENPVGGGLVSTAEWAGTPLGPLLEKAQVRGPLVRLTGADGFTRTLPRHKAMHPDTLLAWAMNGERLPANHGFPLRALVPGWYGMESVKWLRSVEGTDLEDRSPSYRRRVRSLLAGERVTDPVREIQPKSVFSRPMDGAILSGRRFVMRGAAWGGPGPVHVSADGGRTWASARLDESKPYTWALWEWEWKIPQAGEFELVVRAAGQPPERASDRADEYEQNAWQRLQVVVR
jgi:DMSO/TMAO reductase YedYZ molybdopterin-dependent catalytic subunit